MKDFHSLLKQYLRKNSNFRAEIILLFIPLLLIGMYLSLRLLNKQLIKQVEQSTLLSTVKASPVSPFPSVETQYDPFLTAQGAFVLDDVSKVALFSKNAGVRFSMASTTKLMTALVALDYYKPNDILVRKESKTEGTVVGFAEGERLYFDDLLYAMLLPSGNDAAFMIADNYPGGRGAFIKKMNEKATALNFYDTHFADPAGLDDDGNYTTAHDLAFLSSYVKQNDVIARITSTKRRVIANVEGDKEYDISNLNKLLGTHGVTGLKTGSTVGAGEVLTTSMTDNGHSYIIVVMKSDNRFADTEALLQYITGNVTYFVPSF